MMEGLSSSVITSGTPSAQCVTVAAAKSALAERKAILGSIESELALAKADVSSIKV
ncbi:unnamed protein product [Anisakis simplex]|uniref:Uncharacterized protein n=1 Tax=Anisakis simplex TaxID=6269 RepID=A0A3P6P4M8_ANISI|nr:unnamed protein product [Anisakis simplex]